MSEWFPGSDILGALVTALGFVGAIIAYWHNAWKERRNAELQAKRECYDAYFNAAETYCAALRVYSYTPDFDTTEAFISYEATKPKLAFFASERVMIACGEYDKALKSYRKRSRALHRAPADSKDISTLRSERSSAWQEMTAARKQAIYRASCEVGAFTPVDPSKDGFSAVFGIFEVVDPDSDGSKRKTTKVMQ